MEAGVSMGWGRGRKDGDTFGFLSSLLGDLVSHLQLGPFALLAPQDIQHQTVFWSGSGAETMLPSSEVSVDGGSRAGTIREASAASFCSCPDPVSFTGRCSQLSAWLWSQDKTRYSQRTMCLGHGAFLAPSYWTCDPAKMEMITLSCLRFEIKFSFAPLD